MLNTAGAEGSLVVKLPFADGIEREGEELEPSASVELVLELNPVQAKSMEESRQALHDQENCYRQGSKSSKYEEKDEASTQTPHTEANVDHHGPEHLRELCVG